MRMKNLQVCMKKLPNAYEKVEKIFMKNFQVCRKKNCKIRMENTLVIP